VWWGMLCGDRKEAAGGERTLGLSCREIGYELADRTSKMFVGKKLTLPKTIMRYAAQEKDKAGPRKKERYVRR